jgi:hypothetical protein
LADLTKEQRLEKADKELYEEVQEWDKIGVVINATIPTNAFANEVGLKELITYLGDVVPEFDIDEFLIRWRERTKRDLQMHRKEVQKAIILGGLRRQDIPGNDRPH